MIGTGPNLRRGLCLAAAFMVTVGTATASEVGPEVIEHGRTVFQAEAAPPCGACHTLADAGTSGVVGPVLDDLAPNYSRVKSAVAGGIGIMPPYGEVLSAEDIEAVAAYVAAVSGGAPD